MGQYINQMNSFLQKYDTYMVFALILAVFLLGYVFYGQYGLPFGLKTAGQTSPFDYSLSESDDENAKNVLKTPGPNASKEAKRAHFLLAQQLAKEVEYLDITGCKANPVVMKAKAGSTIKVRNQDAQKHSIVLDRDRQSEIPPEGINVAAVNFYNGEGLYGYGCDNSTNAVGMFLVE